MVTKEGDESVEGNTVVERKERECDRDRVYVKMLDRNCE